MRRRWPVLAVLAWGLFTFGPLLGVALASWVAGSHGCRLDEAGTSPCVVAGVDVGGVLSTLFVLGWLGLVTIPVGVLSGGAGLVAWVLWLVSRRRAGPRA